jgi:hypothetical protein
MAQLLHLQKLKRRDKPAEEAKPAATEDKKPAATSCTGKSKG